MQQPDYKAGQKWISNAEPDLGMGKVVKADHRLVTLFFDISQETRTYSRQQAPLTRVQFGQGETVKTLDGISLTVHQVVEKDGILVYHGNYQGTHTAVVETELDPRVRFNNPQDRLFTLQWDENRWFDLRYQTHLHEARLAEADARGLYGPRVSLISHQLYIANEVSTRFAPRVLLADEVGLGKTIEAGLIMHQQLQTGRAERILIIVPQALTFQWFVELIRRFNLQFTLLDEERCEQIQSDNTEEAVLEDDVVETFNPFEAQQLVLCDLSLFLDNPDRLEQCLEAEWDLVVVDEAHHLGWSPEDVSIEYQVVDLIARISRGLLLLTATPEQLGRAGHFARLRLLDPDKYHDYEAFVAEEADYQPVADLASSLLSADEDALKTLRPKLEPLLGAEALQLNQDQLISALLDRHGTGRVLFRNVRSRIEGFPARQLHASALNPPALYENMASTYFPDREVEDWMTEDPRTNFLLDVLDQFPAEKILVICAHPSTALELEDYISRRTGIRTTVFHEGLNLVERDRAAAYFSETERGAQMMICSEIGSEGRNFQFAHHLVMFDLPLSADLLEQRIGRLDRIGQQHDVMIHVPYFSDTHQEVLFRLFHEGLNLFAGPNPAAQSVFDEIFPLIGSADDNELVSQAGNLNQERREALRQGRDVLLELHSHRPDKGQEITVDIATHEGGSDLEQYMELSFDLFGLESEPLNDEVQLIRPGEGMLRHGSVSLETKDRYHYPELPEEGIRVTYDRDTALSREDLQFLTWESPLVVQAMDLVTSDVNGNSAVIVIKHPAIKAGTLLLEVVHIMDSVAPLGFNLSRYLPPTVLRQLIDPQRRDLAPQVPYSNMEQLKQDFPVETLQKIVESQRDGLKLMLNSALEQLDSRVESLKQEARERVMQQLGNELGRLQTLKSRGSPVRDEEIEFYQATAEALDHYIEEARARLDAVRVIVAA